METELVKTGFFKREERIKNPADFKTLFKKGKRANISGAKIFFKENGTVCGQPDESRCDRHKSFTIITYFSDQDQ